MQLRFRPDLYRMVTVVMSDGATYRIPKAVRIVGNVLQLDRDTSNHPVFLAQGDKSRLLDKREASRLQRILHREQKRAGAGAAAFDGRAATGSGS
mmetsp:Transcript_27408/g.45687  ORF Transcript_27408/g.45687 Transcript_27408/m.45687 type:complete len:95 (+) Transcript_27408:38-322(+)